MDFVSEVRLPQRTSIKLSGIVSSTLVTLVGIAVRRTDQAEAEARAN